MQCSSDTLVDYENIFFFSIVSIFHVIFVALSVSNKVALDVEHLWQKEMFFVTCGMMTLMKAAS